MVTERSADAPAGYDEDDPYADTDLESFDPWWRANIELFDAHGMRPYRPPQFADGTHTPPVIDELERTHDVSIRLRVVDPQEGNEWEVLVDETPIGTLDRYRDDGGFSVYEVDSNTFKKRVQTALEAWAVSIQREDRDN